MLSSELLATNAQQTYLSRLSSAWRRSWLSQPSTWLQRDPDVEEKMLRDPDIAHAIQYRCFLIAGRQWTLQPKSKGSPRGDLAVEVGTELLGGIRKFAEARALLARAFFHGQRIARIHGETRLLNIGDGRARWWWMPTRLEDVDMREFRIVPRTDSQTGKIEAHYDRWHIGKAAWEPLDQREEAKLVRHTYQDEQGSLGFGRGLREALGWLWFAKTHVFEESVRAIERHAGGMLKAKIAGLRDASTGLPNEELLRQWLDALENARARHSIAHDAEDDIEVVTGGAEGWQMFTSMLDLISNKIMTLVLSANLTTAATEGGSYALSKVQENSTESVAQFDRESLEETLTDSVVRCTWSENYANLIELGLVEDQPRFNITQEKRLDPKERAEVATSAHNMGLDLAKEDVYEQLGFRKPQEGEDILKGGVAAPGFGGGGGPLDDLFGLRPKPPAPPAPPGNDDDERGPEARKAG